LDSRDIAKLSNGEITVNDVLSMECMILESLSFNLNPPTIYSFTASFYAFLPKRAQNNDGQDLIQRANFLAEISVIDIVFKSLHPCLIAYAALLSALESMNERFLSPCEKQHFLNKIANILEISSNNNQIFLTKNKLTQTCIRCKFFLNHTEEIVNNENNIEIDVRDDAETLESPCWTIFVTN